MRRSLFLLCTIAAVLLVAPEVSAATTLRVDSTADKADAVPGDGRCGTVEQTCTLRAAVMEANAGGQATTIVLPGGRFELAIPPEQSTGTAPYWPGGAALGDLDLQVPVTVRGAGARETIIDAKGLDRVFANAAGNRATISDMTLTGGVAYRGFLPVVGGGAIWNQGELTIRRVTLTGNHADYGGGLFNTPMASAVVDSSTISFNTVTAEGAGIRFDAAGTVVNSTVTGNRILPDLPSWGLDHDGGTVGEGGGIDIRGGGPVTILNSTITGNTAVTGGGGVNIAVGYQGTAGPIGGFGGPLRLQNTIIAGNTTTDRGPANCKNTIAPIESLGHNIAGDDSCALNQPGDQPGTKPLLGPFANHGGPTDTYDLHPDSPAIDAGAACPDVDQRGISRPRGEACDIGAVEH